MATNPTSAPSLFTSIPKAIRNPVFLEAAGVKVYHVRKNDSDFDGVLMGYWFSRRHDNLEAVDVRTLAGYEEPEYERKGDPEASSKHWRAQLAAEAERVIREALATGTFVPQPQ